MSNEIKVTDAEALEWASQLSDQDKAELKRQALLKRAIDLAQPKPEENPAQMNEQEFAAYRRRLGIG
jgi:hypothetical protein